MNDELLSLLEEAESAPSAVNLLATKLGITLDYDPYEASEFTNDSKRDELIAQLTDTQKTELIEDLKAWRDEINQ